jgi:hypothetical protein
MFCVTAAASEHAPVEDTDLAVDELSQICEGLARQRRKTCHRCSMRWRSSRRC